MDQKQISKVNNTGRFSRLMTLVALIITFSIPLILVKSFKPTRPDFKTTVRLALPKPEPIKPSSQPAIQSQANEHSWRVVTTQEHDTLSAIFSRLGLSSKTLFDILKSSPHQDKLTHLIPRQKIQFQIQDNQLEKMIIPFTDTQFLEISRQGDRYTSRIDSRKMNTHSHYLTATVHGSLYGTAKRLNIPFRLIHQMTEIFNWEMDFSRDVREGDQFTIIYKAVYIEDKLVGTGEIQALSYTSRRGKLQAIRHVNAAGDATYYTPEGRSLKKAFSRYPLRFSHISSTFQNGRFHPVLHYKRAHKGVDLAAPLGTPIHATGDGIIETINYNSGYGNVIRISHNKQFTSVYAHMLRFRKGLKKGSYVKRDDIIGYVGQTGLATGPHCHYEFHINGQARNPSTIELPKGEPVPARELAGFKANAGTLLAHLKLFEEANMASSKAIDVG